jgi:exonuclease SbcD
MTIKLLHTADIHIGLENYGRFNPATGLNTRLEDFAAALDEAVERAIAEPVDLVVLAGDIYKTRDPTPTHQRIFAQRVRRLIQAQIPLYIAAGNHDLPMTSGRATSVDIFRELELPGVHVARNIGRRTIETRSGPLQVIGLPWVTRNALLTREEYRHHTVDQLNARMIELATSKLVDLAAELDPTVPAIVVGHAHLASARVGAERMLTMGTDPVFPLEALAELPNVDYVALGHIHKHQVLRYDRPPIVYAGSLNRVDFSEEDELKGFVLAEVEPGGADQRFVPVRARTFLTIDARAESDDPTRDVLKAVYAAGQKVRDAVVRLRVKTTSGLASRLDETEIRGQLKEAHYLLPIQKELTDSVRERAGGRDLQGKGPLELLELYLEGHNIPPDRREALSGLARGLLDDLA